MSKVIRCSIVNYVKIRQINRTMQRISKKRLDLWFDKSEHRVVPRKEGNTLNVTEMIERMLAIDTDIKTHETAIVELRQEGQGLRSEVEATFTSLPFGLPAIATAKPPKSEGKDDLKVGLKLALKRAIAKAHAEGAAKDIVASIADAAGRRFVERRNAELPTWVGEWSKQMIDKTFPQPQVEKPVVERTEVAKPEPTKTSKKPKK